MRYTFNKKEYNRKYYQEHREEHDRATREWAKNHPDYQKDYYCQNREREIKQACDYQKKNLEKIQEKHRDYFYKKRMKVFELLGGKCVQCGETDWRCLQIDHINGGGCKHHKLKQTWGVMIDVINDPDRKSKYQLLCANCNWKKRFELKEHNDHNLMWEFRKP